MSKSVTITASSLIDAVTALPSGAVVRAVLRRRDGDVQPVRDAVAEEVPVALLYNGRPHLVMMATPNDLEDFALGFSLTEGIIAEPSQCLDVARTDGLAGIELRIAIPPAYADRLLGRERALAGRTGCGLCGERALEAAVRQPAPVDSPIRIDTDALLRALRQMPQLQTLNQVTGATHAAAWVAADGDIRLLREDVGRHNALDKLIGAMHRAGLDPRDGFILVSSRASYEMAMKAAMAGVGLLAAVSAPTALAIALARQCGLTLVGFARANGHVVYTHPWRLSS